MRWTYFSIPLKSIGNSLDRRNQRRAAVQSDERNAQ